MMRRWWWICGGLMLLALLAGGLLWQRRFFPASQPAEDINLADEPVMRYMHTLLSTWKGRSQEIRKETTPTVRSLGK